MRMVDRVFNLVVLLLSCVFNTCKDGRATYKKIGTMGLMIYLVLLLRNFLVWDLCSERVQRKRESLALFSYYATRRVSLCQSGHATS